MKAPVRPAKKKAAAPKPKRKVLVARKRIAGGNALRRSRLLRAVRLAARKAQPAQPRLYQLERHEGNPIIEPRERNYWEMKATFNPGAIYADRRVHLLYRAIGGDDVSVLGYASSGDGRSVMERLNEPAYIPHRTKSTTPDADRCMIEPAYLSGGGGSGGCEDPRLTLIEDTVYLTYTAFDGWGSIRIALSSIPLKDFLAKRWNWDEPALISPPGEIHKNWVLFPEKINGKFAILHSISPNILIDYFDSLEELKDGERTIQGSLRRMEVTDPGRWEYLVRGAGPPPLRTKDGWLLLYHAVERDDPWKYKLGAMLLDLSDPTKVLYRCDAPILEPELHYESSGLKAGIVYSCGAVIVDGELYVYYGGADSVTCVAMANLDRFLDELKRHGTPRLSPEKKENVRNDGRR